MRDWKRAPSKPGPSPGTNWRFAARTRRCATTSRPRKSDRPALACSVGQSLGLTFGRGDFAASREDRMLAGADALERLHMAGNHGAGAGNLELGHQEEKLFLERGTERVPNIRRQAPELLFEG